MHALGALGGPLHIYHSAGCPMVVMWWSHPHTWFPQSSTVCSSFQVLFVLFFVWHVSCAHPNSSSPTWVPLVPLCPSTHSHMSTLWNFPDHKWAEIIPWWPIFLCIVSLFVLFSYVLVLWHLTAPVYIRPHPSAPTHTLDYIQNMYILCILWSEHNVKIC